MAITVLDEIQKAICNSATYDFEKVDDIVRIFIKNGIATGECHDF